MKYTDLNENVIVRGLHEGDLGASSELADFPELLAKYKANLDIYVGALSFADQFPIRDKLSASSPSWPFAAAFVAVLFGILTVLMGGGALFGGGASGQPSAMQWRLSSGLISLLASPTRLPGSACFYGAGGRHSFLPSLLFLPWSFLLPLVGMWRLGAPSRCGM